MIIRFHRNFEKDYWRASAKIKLKFKERLELFSEDEFSSVLNNHPLKGGFAGYRSINITGDIRAIYKKTDTAVIFVALDSHGKLYR